MQCAYVVNNGIGVYLKYRCRPNRTENSDGKQTSFYQFQFDREALAILKAMKQKYDHIFLGMVCVEAEEICCLPYDSFIELQSRRKKAKGAIEDQYTLTVALLSGGKFRVFVTPPGRRKVSLGDLVLVARKDFPEKLFE
ncbi:MAG: hypothetical protein KAV82_12900 [Phycisphaerae bacterium]|nr:hypothetical protein [Phycisphaerae bacterium]